MNTRKFQPSYTDFAGTVSNTVPGRCYSVAELLARTIRNQPLPLMNTYTEKDDGRNSDKEIDEDMVKAEKHPFFERDSDEIEAFDHLQSPIS